MKKILFPLLAAALAMTACDSKTTEQAAGAEAQTEATAQIGSSDIAYVQVEAVLAQCDLFLNDRCRSRGFCCRSRYRYYNLRNRINRSSTLTSDESQ